MSTPLLQVKNLCTSFDVDAGEVRAVNGISFNLEKGKVLGIVGESGSGKSVTAYSIMRILVEPGRIKGGEILFNGEDITKYDDRQMRAFRGEKISIIFQDPMTSLNPVYTIGNQLREAILLHTDRNREQANARALEMLQLVGVNEPEKRLKQYPHELSGGMRQRVMIAMALACEPDILIADEPTTALDVTIQAQILELMQDLQKKLGIHQGPDALHPPAGQQEQEADSHRRFPGGSHQHAQGLCIRFPLRLRHEDLHGTAARGISHQRLPHGVLLDECARCIYGS